MMSATVTPPDSTIADNTQVPPDIQKQLRDYWQQFGPYHGEIIPAVGWDGGTTTWDDGATIWVN
jgi:hypothetical protein